MRWLLGGLAPKQKKENALSANQQNRIIFAMLLILLVLAVFYVGSFYV